jgi:magnesium-transporting ATPase (P-type)
MALMGIVALQDELRDHAVETVDMLRDANINIFMVSGDNRENCVNVAYNTGILKKGMTVRHLKIDNELGSRAAIKSLLDGIQNQI